MAYGETVSRVRAEFREFRFKESLVRVRKAVDVIHVSRNRVLILFPLTKAPVLKALTAKQISLIAPDGRDLVKEWREPLCVRPSIKPGVEPFSGFEAMPRKG
ncbi:hypothetical protein [Rhizobium ruizarguesonis]|uniref:hypothetical protein n=1 Tax=Rhizobium ruizarguesonis TaxID=2081791 RepID=UPI001CF5AD91|nr:hypothetical protein [Rhizobium ruizarguesonis]MCB2403562.1 hypothetical protein [Rhizobium ruizarguesonis]